jgi:wyosine [tRNA(Phe)-imidazoG37] synthetase (radical SAM superfamily)
VSHVFGPVPSRRLGLSLGIDPLEPKTCTMDCVYCELGPTSQRTVCRTSGVTVGAVLAEVAARLPDCPGLRFLTISGSGEPTLYAHLGPLIEGLRGLSALPVAVLTNGSLMTDPQVCAALALADVVAPSLDAVSPGVFRLVNRPHPSLDPGAIAEAIARFSSRFGGELWLETLFVQGLNDDPGEIALLASAVRMIGPDRVHVNTVVRPPADPSAAAVPPERLKEIAALLSPLAEVIAPRPVAPVEQLVPDPERVIVEMAARRPVTASDVAKMTGLDEKRASAMLASLVEKGLLELVPHGGKLYHRTQTHRGRS